MSLIGIGETAVYNKNTPVTIIDYIRNNKNIVTAYEVRTAFNRSAIADLKTITVPKQ